MNRVRLAFSLLLVCSLSVVAAAASSDAVRFTGSPGVVQMRVEVLSPSGTALYDSDWRSGNVFDWIVGDNLGHALPYGSYRVVTRSKDLEGRTSEKQTTLYVSADKIGLDASAGSELKMILTAHDGETGQLVTTSGDLSFRFGDFLNRKDTEVMRLTAEGNLGIGTDKPQARLDVNGLIRTSEGIMFPDGSIQRSAAMPTIVRMRPSNPESDKKLHPKGDIGGSGTTNQMTKWLDASGTVGDSAVTEVGGKVGIGTLTPGGQLHIYGASNLDVVAGIGPDLINGPAMNYGYAGNSFGVGTGFFNVRPAAGATGVNPSLRFMTVDTQRMIITNAGNVGIGTSTPGSILDVNGNVNAASVTLAGDLALPATTSASAGVITLGGSPFAHSFGILNTFLGIYAGNFTMAGYYNTASGYAALYNNTTGYTNTASGFGALYSNTTGHENTASGGGALQNNTSGNWNTADGSNALYSNTTGDSNTASGWSALTNNTTGHENMASGGGALYNNTTGYFNTAIGFDTLFLNDTGFYNTAIGFKALVHNTGADNIAIGGLAGYDLTTGNHNIHIANRGIAAEERTMRIGGSAQTRTFIGGIRGVTTGNADAVAVLIDSTGQLGTASSSRRYKFDIAGMGDATEGLMRLRPVTFRYLVHGDHAPLQYGLIAEEVAEVYPELVTRNKDGEVETVMYQFLAPMLLNEVQKQHRTIAEQQQTIDAHHQRADQLARENEALRIRLERVEETLTRLTKSDR